MRSLLAKTFLLLILTTLSFGSECNEKEKILEEAYNAPYTTDLKCSPSYFLTASYIFWQAIEDGLNLAFFENQTSHSTIKTDFDFKSGFKLGFGVNTKYDNWIVYSEYTRLLSHGHSGRTAKDDESITPLWIDSTIDGVTVNSSMAKGLWKLTLNFLDLQLGRPYYVGSKLVLNTFFGLKTVWIDQNFFSFYNLTSPVGVATRNLKSDSWGIGPLLGFDANYLVSKGFKFLSGGSFSLFYQHFSLHNKYQFTSDHTVTDQEVSTDKSSYLTPNLKAFLGLGWGSQFNKQKMHFDLLASYEFQIFWNQNMLRSFKDLMTSSVNGASGDLMLQGLTLTAKWNF